MSSGNNYFTKPFAQGDKNDLEKHLQAACDLELWTIPLYLTATYSMSSPVPINLPDDTPSTAQNLLISVALQEMYHLQLACNLTTAAGFKPKLNIHPYDSIPYINAPLPEGAGFGDVNKAVKLLVAVETPDPNEMPPPSLIYTKDPNEGGTPIYDSIGDLYAAMIIIFDQLLANNTFSISEGKQFYGTSFKKWYTYVNQVVDKYSAEKAKTIIVEQGEGAVGENQDAPLKPHDQPVQSHPFYNEDRYSHYERFKLIEDHGHIDCQSSSGTNAEAQKVLQAVFNQLVSDLRLLWDTGGSNSTVGANPDGQITNLEAMHKIKKAIDYVFKNNALPQFYPTISPGISYEDAKKKLDNTQPSLPKNPKWSDIQRLLDWLYAQNGGSPYHDKFWDSNSDPTKVQVFGHNAITPGDPENSVMYVRLTSSSSGSQMPPGGPYISPDNDSILKDYITNLKAS